MEYGTGLYSSADGGRTWDFLSPRSDLGQVRLTRNGDIYAEQFVVGGLRPQARLLKSSDGGRSWLVAYPWVRSMEIVDDPDDPDLVALKLFPALERSNGLTRFHAARNEWTFEPARREGSRQTPFFDAPEGESRPNRIDGATQATLKNYFPGGFQKSLFRSPLSLRVDGRFFAFRATESKALSLKILYEADTADAWVYDDQETTSLFQLRVLFPDGQRVYVGPRGGILSESSRQLKPIYNEAAKARPIRVSRQLPYERSLDLGEMLNFPMPGDYQLQVIFDPSLGSYPETFPATAPAACRARLTSPQLTIRIVPADK
jgi:hypothetical protein